MGAREANESSVPKSQHREKLAACLTERTAHGNNRVSGQGRIKLILHGGTGLSSGFGSAIFLPTVSSH
jgi:hypothetical protein